METKFIYEQNFSDKHAVCHKCIYLDYRKWNNFANLMENKMKRITFSTFSFENIANAML